jgi:HAD superfamily hydrolase (TIGR01459 family)
MMSAVSSDCITPDLLSIASPYDAFVFDQFGVLHNGTELYPNVLEALRALKASGKNTLVLTNSGRSASENYQRLEAMGIEPALIDDVITSGDVAVQHVLPSYALRFGGNCYHVASEMADPKSVGSVGRIRIVDNPCDCDFVYLSGIPAGAGNTWRQDLLPMLVTVGAPLLCSNPDNVAPGADGLSVSPGTIAKAYRDQGGAIEMVGKPYPLIYRSVRQRLAELNCKTPLFIGDSYHHDIVGAGRAGFDSLLVLTGIHRALFENGDVTDTLNRVLIENGIAPTWVSSTL